LHKILLLEDDELLAQTIKNLLINEGYQVDLVYDFEEALEFTYDNRYDLYLFDINIPFGNGIDLLRDLREAGDKTPTFFITALKDIKSISKGFDAGCDDYIKKPFDFDELLVRIKAMIRKNNNFLEYGDLKYDPDNDTLLYKGSEPNIGTISKKVLILFLSNRGRIIKKDEIYELMQNPTDVALRVMINKIKQQFSLNITNIRGVGYKLENL